MLKTLKSLAHRTTGRASRPPSSATIRFAHETDAEAINTLYNDPLARPDAAGIAPRSSAQWRWEFIEQANANPAYLVAELENRIVGTQGYIPIAFVRDGRLISTGKDEDTLVHPDHRGRGLLDAMYRPLAQRAESDGVALLWGFTRTAVEPLKRNDYVDVGLNDSMASSRWSIPDDQGGGLDVREWIDPDEQCDSFSLEFSRRVTGIMPHLTQRFLRWRIVENPFRAYRMLAAYVAGKLTGLAVFKLHDRRETGFISELVAMPTARHSESIVLQALLRQGLLIFQNEGYHRVEARPSGMHPFNQRVRSLLKDLGFVEQPRALASTFLIRPLMPEADHFLDMSQWRISEIMREY
ncbi:MAG: GNAT family N-acetyltransferase [Planctomycetota bacterium]